MASKTNAVRLVEQAKIPCREAEYEFDENEIPNRGCSGCGKHGCHSVHCPNCGFGNSPELDQEFDFIIKLKDKIKNRKKATH